MTENSQELLERTKDFFLNHRDTYINSGGVEGHIVDFSFVDLDRFLPTLLLKTIGRRSGRPSVTPLIYGIYGGCWVVVGSKGGSPDHPAWYYNLKEQKETVFQVASQCYRAAWREPQGKEWSAVWEYMAELFPNYKSYQESAGTRRIPLVMLKPFEKIPVLE